MESLHELAEGSDVISLHASLTATNAAMIDDAVINAMKGDVILVNNARGGLVDEAAVIRGLESGKLRHYCADVLSTEPINRDHPFVGNPRISVTPHVGSRTRESVERQGSMAVENLSLMLQGKSPIAEPEISRRIFGTEESPGQVDTS